jgi:hypothetical protein
VAEIEQRPRGRTPARQEAATPRRVWGIIIYPFTHPADARGRNHLRRLYEQVQTWSKDELYAPFLTVINRQTKLNAPRAVRHFVRTYVDPCSDVLEVWSVDTCQMWLAGFGARLSEPHDAHDVYWLIPGDFDYASPDGRKVLKKMKELPRRVLAPEGDEPPCRICLGEIEISQDNAKHLVDVYGTYGLLSNWFPKQARGLRKRGIIRPRSEFFAIDGVFLDEVLRERWYAYEQTLVILLYGVGSRGDAPGIAKIKLGQGKDAPQGRDTLAVAMTQVERMERVLKNHWRETNREEPAWDVDYRALDARSEQIRGAALGILGQSLSGAR